MEEVSEMRVRDIKRALTRRHGYSTDEVGRVLDKKELIQTLSFEEHKINQKELETERRDLFWKGLWVTIVVGVITLCWPMIRHLLEVAHVNLVVYTDRKYLEMSRCWDYRSIEGCLGLIFIFTVDLLQLWLTISVLLSWVMRSKFFFPMPNISIRPAALMGGDTSQSSLASYGINVAPMAITWGLRFMAARLEGWVGRAFKRAAKVQKKRHRAQETQDERAARKQAKRMAKEEALRQSQQQDPGFNQGEPEICPLTDQEIRDAAAQIAEESRCANLESNTEFDDLD